MAWMVVGLWEVVVQEGEVGLVEAVGHGAPVSWNGPNLVDGPFVRVNADFAWLSRVSQLISAGACVWANMVWHEGVVHCWRAGVRRGGRRWIDSFPDG
jgi:hypothetical protein